MPGDRRNRSRRTSDSKRSRSRPNRPSDHEEEEEEVLDHGRDTLPPPTAEPTPRPAQKRKRDMAKTAQGLADTEAGAFFASLLQTLSERPDCQDFRAPVFELWEDDAIPEYRDKITTPMDLRTASERLQEGYYAIPPVSDPTASHKNNRHRDRHPNQRPEPDQKLYLFDENAAAADIRLIFLNAMEYNEVKSAMHQTAKRILSFVDDYLAARQQKLQRLAERAKRDAERRRRKQAEDQAAAANAKAARTVAELQAAKRIAEEAEQRRIADLKRQEAEWRMRLEKVKQQANAAMQSASTVNDATAAAAAAVAAAVPVAPARPRPMNNALTRPLVTTVPAPAKAAPVAKVEQKPPTQLVPPVRMPRQQATLQQAWVQPTDHHKPFHPPQPNLQVVPQGRVIGATQPPGNLHVPPPAIAKDTTSSVSSDESDTTVPEITFAFVSTAGMEKKRGRKSAQVMDLEVKHDAYMRRRKVLVDLTLELEREKKVMMTAQEKASLCEQVSNLDFVRMKAVADLIARGMNRGDILNKVEVDLDVQTIDNVVLREIQFFLNSPTAMTLKEELRSIEAKIATIETQLVEIRFQKVA